jgi:hypothetical protein
LGDNSVQSIAYTNARNTDLNNSKNKLTDILYSNNKTTVENNLECDNITGLTITNINNLIDEKQNIFNSGNKLNSNFINGGDNLTSQKIIWLSSIAEDLQTKLNDLQDSINALSASDSSQTSLNTSLTNSINDLIINKQDLLSDLNKLNSSHINAGTGQMTNLKMQHLSSITGDLSSAINSKQNTITDASLTIARTDGLQNALDGKLNSSGLITNDLNMANKAITGVSMIQVNSLNSSNGGSQMFTTHPSGICWNTLNIGLLSTNYVIDEGRGGHYIFFTLNAARTITLPNPNNMASGCFIGCSIISSSTTSFVATFISRPTSINLIQLNAGTSAFSGGVGVTFINSGSAWRVFT